MPVVWKKLIFNGKEGSQNNSDLSKLFRSRP